MLECTPFYKEICTYKYGINCTGTKRITKIILLLKIFWVVTRRRCLVYDQRFGITCLSHLQVFPKTLKMVQTSDAETLVMHQKMTPGNNPKYFKQHYDHGGSLQLQKPLYM
jgi:hypothetical protein